MRGIGHPLVAFSPVGRGALCGSLRDPAMLEDSDLRTKMPRFNAENWPQNLALIDQLAALAQSAGMNAAQLSLHWVLAQSDVIHAIPGTTSMAHLEENMAVTTLPVSAEVLAEAGRIINQQTVAGHRYHDAIIPSIDTEDFV